MNMKPMKPLPKQQVKIDLSDAGYNEMSEVWK